MHVNFYYFNLRFPETNSTPTKQRSSLSPCVSSLWAVTVALSHYHPCLRSLKAVNRNFSSNTHQCLRCQLLLQFFSFFFSVVVVLFTPMIFSLLYFCRSLAISQKLHCSHKFIQFCSIGAVEREYVPSTSKCL